MQRVQGEKGCVDRDFLPVLEGCTATGWYFSFG